MELYNKREMHIHFKQPNRLILTYNDVEIMYFSGIVRVDFIEHNDPDFNQIRFYNTMEQFYTIYPKISGIDFNNKLFTFPKINSLMEMFNYFIKGK